MDDDGTADTDHDHGADGHHDHHDHDHEHDEHGGDHEHHHEHDHDHHDVENLGAAVVTVSSSRTIEEDAAGDAIEAAVEDAGHSVVTRELVGDDYDRIQSIVNTVVDRDDVDAVVTTGGTGVTPDDVTVEAVGGLLDKELPGFGELFRRFSFEEIGTRVVATRAHAGVVGRTPAESRRDSDRMTDGVPVFCLPGSESAARLGAERIIVPEASHLAGLARRPGQGEEDEASDAEGGDEE